MTNRFQILPLEGLVNFKTGKLNSNASKPDGIFPFFTCSQETFLTDTYSFNGEYVLLGGNNAAGVFPLKYFNGKFDAYQRTYVINALDTGVIINRYIYYALRLQLELMKSIAVGVATKFLTLPLLNQTLIPVPPVHTQRKIASILSAYDDLIENNLRRIKILEEMAQNLYREWFVKFRFPGHESARFVESPLGMIPKGWEVKALGKIATQVRDAVQPSSVDPETPYFGLEHLPRKSIALSDWGFAGEVKSTKLLFIKGDILFGKIRPYFHKVGVAPFSGVCSSDTIVIRPREDDWFGLVLGCTSSVEFVEHATGTSQGTKMPRANWDVLVKYQISMPNRVILCQYNGVMRDIVSQLHNFVFRNHTLRRTRDMLLHKLISGEMDVSKLDIAIPEEAVA
jgi:type I restriction enzyme, S subunit